MIRHLLLLASFGGGVLAQAQGTAVAGTLTDPMDAPVPGARVTLAGGSQPREVHTGSRGEFRFDQVAPGAYEIGVTVAGFDPIRRAVSVGTRPVLRVELRLKLAKLKEELTVAEPQFQAAADPSRNADTISVERNLLDALPVLDLNYLAALSRFISPGTPGDAGVSLVVDGMEMRNVGVTASAIQEIRINNNPYTAEYPRWSRRRIEVITKSSADRYHGTFNFLFRDHRFNAREALALERPPEQRRIYEGSLFGPLRGSKKASFLLSGTREEEDLQAVVFAQGPAGPIRANVATPQVNTYVSARISWQPNDRHGMFFQQNFQDRWRENAGVGGATLQEAGILNRFREDEFIFNHRMIVSPKLLSQFRILIGRFWQPNHSNRRAPGVVVSDAFTGGGAQADRLGTEFHTSITWLLTQTAGRHTFKYGINVPDWSRRGLVDRTNQEGTLYFGSLADLAANRPYAALLQRGDPKVIFIEKNLGGFFQDEWQFRKNLSLALGVRYDWQNFFGDHNNLAPRAALAWSPGRARNMVFRAGAGMFSERSGPGPVFDILRFNGIQLRRYLLPGADFPGFGQPLPPGLPASVHRLAPGVGLPNVWQFSAGLERQLAKKTTLAVNYVGVRAVQQLRSRDGNAPLPPLFSARPDPTLNVLRWIESAGRMAGNSLEITLRGEIAPRVTGTAQYVFGKTQSDTGGLNWFPANSFSPAGEWGRADSDRRHSFNFLGALNLHRWANFGLSVSLLSGLPFNITTGRDDNGDGLANDRPSSVRRNAGQGPGFAGVDLRWYREFRFRPTQKEKSPAATLSVDAFNLFNRVNYQNFVGALSSPFYGRALGTQPSRRVQLALRFQF
jgi:outer membrane receptor protein involved in Fe transport